jgi:DNA-binding protein H-NS
MNGVTMSEEDREELARLQRQVEQTTAARKEAIAARNALMHELYNSYRADVHEILKVTGLRARDMVHTIVKGPRTGGHRAVSNTPSIQREHPEDR